jgi:hypothetical protein
MYALQWLKARTLRSSVRASAKTAVKPFYIILALLKLTPGHGLRWRRGVVGRRLKRHPSKLLAGG